MKWFHGDEDFLRSSVGQECSEEPTSELHSEFRLHPKLCSVRTRFNVTFPTIFLPLWPFRNNVMLTPVIFHNRWWRSWDWNSVRSRKGYQSAECGDWWMHKLQYTARMGRGLATPSDSSYCAQSGLIFRRSLAPISTGHRLSWRIFVVCPQSLQTCFVLNRFQSTFPRSDSTQQHCNWPTAVASAYREWRNVRKESNIPGRTVNKWAALLFEPTCSALPISDELVLALRHLGRLQVGA